VISWGTIAYGATLTVVVVALLTWVVTRRTMTAVVSGLAAGGGALAWNAILHSASGEGFFVDARIAVLPASWQDTVSGVFAVAATAVAVGFGPERRASARSSVALAVLAGVGAFAVDVYLY